MTWLHHPKFVPIRDAALRAVKRDVYRFRRTKPVIFLCGGRDSKPRDRVAEYLRTKADSLVFYAEEIWAVIARENSQNALEMEARLADLSDIVIVIVESPGTFAELGAFSLSPILRKKLLPILPADHRGTQSFIESGPIGWVDAESTFKPSLWVDLDTILEAGGQLDDRLDRLSSRPIRAASLGDSPKHLLLFTCDLVAIFGPCPVEHVQYYLSETLGTEPPMSASMLLSLAVAMELLVSFNDERGNTFYARKIEDGKLLSYHDTKRFLGLDTLRAKVLSSMQIIEAGRTALQQLGAG